jgi:hypothetical protein
MLPIERVFEEIREHLKATLNGDVSNPQTWLGDAPTDKLITPLTVKAPHKENRPAHAQETVQREGAREPHDDVSVRSSRLSQLSQSTASSVMIDRPIHQGGTSATSVLPEVTDPFLPSAPKLPSPQKTVIPEKPAVDASNIQAPVILTPPPSLPQSQHQRLPPIPQSSEKPLSDEISAAQLGQADGPEFKKSEISEEPTTKGEMPTKPVAKQDEKQKSPEKPPSIWQLQEPLHTQKRRGSDVVLPTHYFTVLPVEDDMELDSLGRLGIVNLEPRMRRVLPLFRRYQDGRGRQISRSIVTEVVIFNDLMCQVLHIEPSTDPEDGWWRGTRWPDLLLSKVGRTKTELILGIVAEEVQLIRLVIRNEVRLSSTIDDGKISANVSHQNGLDGLQRIISRGRFSGVFHTSRILVWDPIISKLVSNRQRLNSLVESHQKMVSELSAKNLGLEFDCTPQLELFKALELHLNREDKALSVGLRVPKNWIYGKFATEIQEIATLRYRPGWRMDFDVLEWWLIESHRLDSGLPGSIRGIPDVFDYGRSFSASIERIDGSKRLMDLHISRIREFDVLSFGDFIRDTEPSREATLKIALCLSAGMIFLSPTPWYSPNSTGIWEKAFIIYGGRSGPKEIMFIPSPKPKPIIPELGGSEKAITSVTRTILGELGLALIEIALRRRLSGDEKEKQIDSGELSRSGLVALEMGVEYQDIVNTCFTCKYENDSGVVQIDESSATFRKNANEGIVVPLRKLWRESEGESRSPPDEGSLAGPSRKPKLAGRTKGPDIEAVIPEAAIAITVEKSVKV